MTSLRFLTLIFLALILVSCTASGPVQIASIPSLTPIAKFPPDLILYHDDLEILVPDVEQTADKAAYRASVYNGYLVNSYSWYTDGRKIITLELAVPTINFEYLRSDLKGLGQVIHESLTGQPTNPGWDEAYPGYSQISLQLRSSAQYFAPMPVNPTSWRPIRTLQKAFSVFLSIFGFLLDILIWVLVVGGPFLLIGLGIGVVLRKRRTSKTPAPDVDRQVSEETSIQS